MHLLKANRSSVVLLLMLLSACASKPIAPVEDVRQPTPQLSPTELSEVRDIEERKLQKAEEAIGRNDFDELERALASIQVGVLTAAQKVRRQMTIIRFYLYRGNPGFARRYVQTLNDELLINLDRDLQSRWFFTHADVLAAQGDLQTSLRLRLLLDERLSAAESADNHPAILELMDEMEMSFLLKEAQLAPDLYMRGWYDFGALLKIDPGSARLNPYDYWRQSYPGHPALRYFDLLTERYFPPLNQYSTVAFLLPFSGNLGDLSATIYEGYHLSAQDNLAIVDSIQLDTNVDPLEELLDMAYVQDVDLIIGPLRKEKVAEVYYLLKDMEISLVALNDLPSRDAQGNAYSLDISIERSAQFAMDMAWHNQCRWALLLMGDTPLSGRIAREVRNTWEKRGGLLLKAGTIHNQASLSQQVAEFVEVDAAELAATKEIYRRYLRVLGRLGWSGGEIEDILAGKREEEKIPFIKAREDERLLLKDEEIAWIHQPYYEKDFLVQDAGAENGTLDEELQPTGIEKIEEDAEEDYSRYSPQELLDMFKREMEDSYERVEADCVFLAMERDMASQVRPFLSFYLANDMEVYGTFLLFDRELNPRSYGDLQDVGYGEMPWISDLIRAPSAASLDSSTSVHSLRYHAIGRDAFLVGQSLARMNAALNASPFFILGHSGLLELQQGGRIVNQPRGVIFNRGVPRPPAKRSIFQ